MPYTSISQYWTRDLQGVGTFRTVAVMDLTASTAALTIETDNLSNGGPSTNTPQDGMRSRLLSSEVAAALDRSRREGR